jgi:hypothetical protein
MQNPFRYFNGSPGVIRVAVMMSIRYPLSPRRVEDPRFERGVGICHETVRFWWNRFGPMFAAEIRKRRVQCSSYSNCCSEKYAFLHVQILSVRIREIGDEHLIFVVQVAACTTMAGSFGNPKSSIFPT